MTLWLADILVQVFLMTQISKTIFYEEKNFEILAIWTFILIVTIQEQSFLSMLWKMM